MIAEADSQPLCAQSSASSAIPPPSLTPIGRSTEIHRAACINNPSFSTCHPKSERRANPKPPNNNNSDEKKIRPTAKIAPTATQPLPTPRIHNRPARLPHPRRPRRPGRNRRRRPVRRAVAEPHLARLGAAVQILALDVVLGPAVPVGTAAAVVVARQGGVGGGDAGAGTGDAAGGVAADVYVGDEGDVGG